MRFREQALEFTKTGLYSRNTELCPRKLEKYPTYFASVIKRCMLDYYLFSYILGGRQLADILPSQDLQCLGVYLRILNYKSYCPADAWQHNGSWVSWQDDRNDARPFPATLQYRVSRLPAELETSKSIGAQWWNWLGRQEDDYSHVVQ